jgi:uncharacterized protein DUF4411
VRKYCLDTSGFSSPLENMPEDIHATLWLSVAKLVEGGTFAVTTEIYEELELLPGAIGDCIKKNKAHLHLEIEDEGWDWRTYLDHVERMSVTYADVISEKNGNRKNTIGYNDLSIIALAKTLGLPVISSEKKLHGPQDSKKRQKIPDICDKEGVPHMTSMIFLGKRGSRTDQSNPSKLNFDDSSGLSCRAKREKWGVSDGRDLIWVATSRRQNDKLGRAERPLFTLRRRIPKTCSSA